MLSRANVLQEKICKPCDGVSIIVLGTSMISIVKGKAEIFPNHQDRSNYSSRPELASASE